MGPSNFSVRLPSALLGVASVYLIFLLAGRLYPNKKYLGEITALVLTLSPWHLHYTRNATEQATLFFLVLLGIYLYLKNLSSKKYSALFLIPFVLTFYTYSIANLFVPLLGLILVIAFPPDWKKLLERQSVMGTILAFLLFIPIGYQILLGPAAGRFKLINIFADPKTVEQVIIDRTQPWVKNQAIETFFHNKYLAYGQVFVSNYLTSFSPNFLFLHGDPNYRQSIARFGEVLLIWAPFLFIGLVVLFSKENRKSNFLVLLWLLAIPVPSASTIGGGDHASRLFLMNFPLTLLVGLGVIHFFHELKRPIAKISLVILSFLVILNFAAYWYQYAFQYRYDSLSYWQYGYESLFKIAKPHLNGKRRVFVNNTANPSLYRFAFYTAYPPSDFQKNFKGDITKKDIIEGFDGFQFGDNYFFGKIKNFSEITTTLSKGDLYLAAQGEEVPGDWDWSITPPSGLKPLGVVRNFRGQPIFYVMEKI